MTSHSRQHSLTQAEAALGDNEASLRRDRATLGWEAQAGRLPVCCEPSELWFQQQRHFPPLLCLDGPFIITWAVLSSQSGTTAACSHGGHAHKAISDRELAHQTWFTNSSCPTDRNPTGLEPLVPRPRRPPVGDHEEAGTLRRAAQRLRCIAAQNPVCEAPAQPTSRCLQTTHLFHTGSGFDQSVEVRRNSYGCLKKASLGAAWLSCHV